MGTSPTPTTPDIFNSFGSYIVYEICTHVSIWIIGIIISLVLYFTLTAIKNALDEKNRTVHETEMLAQIKSLESEIKILKAQNELNTKFILSYLDNNDKIKELEKELADRSTDSTNITDKESNNTDNSEYLQKITVESFLNEKAVTDNTSDTTDVTCNENITDSDI